MFKHLAVALVCLFLAVPALARGGGGGHGGGHSGGSHHSSSGSHHSSVGSSSGSVSVRGYTRKDGTYVAPHHRSAPNGTKADNYSTRGNINPYTGKPGTKPP